MNTTENILQKIALLLAMVAVVQVMILLIPAKNLHKHVNTETRNNYAEH